MLFLDVTTTAPIDSSTTQSVNVNEFVSNAVSTVSGWLGCSEQLASGVMGVIAFGLVVFTIVFFNKTRKKAKRGYYR